MKIYILRFFFILTVSLTLTACENENQKNFIHESIGIEHYKNGNFIKALPLLEKAALSGNIDASLYLGDMYQYGKGVKEDYSKSFKWYMKAAEKGDKEASGMVGASYYLGRGVEQDYKKSLNWLLKAAEKIDYKKSDIRDGQLTLLLAKLYFDGKGTLQDFSEAAKWAQKGAELGNAKSQGMMAFFLFSGQGVLQNKSEAKKWAEKAARKNDAFGQHMLGGIYEFPSIGEKTDMKNAVHWYKQASERGVQVSTLQLARIYEEGKGIEKDKKKAHQYYELAAKQGSIEAVEKIRELEKANSIR